jgi:putative glutamine amidotransferase
MSGHLAFMSGAPLSEERAAAGESLPLVGVTCCARPFGESIGHTVVEKYILAVSEGAGGLPLLVPALGHDIPPAAVAARLDGLLVTGARSNVEPHHYEGEPSLPDTLHDPARDSMTLPLLRAAVAADVPVLAICRGIQELNVALGGTLHQRLHEVSGRLDHRAPQGTVAERYAYKAHEVELAPDGLFARLAGARRLMVNSLHWQGIDRLAPGLTVEATAPDGQIEGVRLPGARFVVGVQWHPEYRLGDNPFSRALFAAFGAACRAYAAGRRAA